MGAAGKTVRTSGQGALPGRVGLSAGTACRAAAVLALALACGCAGRSDVGASGFSGAAPGPSSTPPDMSPGSPEPAAVRRSPGGGASPRLPRNAGAPKPEPPPKIPAAKLTRALDRFLGSYGGRVTATVRDLATGRVYDYHRGMRLPTASGSKINILMAVLLRTPWRRLDGQGRFDAGRMIRFSDNGAADRLYERVGLDSGLTWANRRFGLRNTYVPPGRCVDLYCWGITQTTARDQVRLIRSLVRKRSPLARSERERVLRLMARVIPEQRWGISAAACEHSRVSLKNGWLRHVANGRWAVISIGLIREIGHQYAMAVLTEDSPTMGEGIAKVEGTAGRILSAFRGARKCAVEEYQSALPTLR